MAVNTTQGIVLAIFGANAGGHLTSLDANATANGNASLAADLSASAGLILGVDLSSDAAFTSTVLGNLGIAEDSAGYTLASNYFTTNLAAGAGRGDLVASAVEYLLGSSVDASLADTATSFSTRVTDGVTYSQGEGAAVFGVAQLQTAAGSAATAGEGSTFELTDGDDTLSGTAGNDTFTGTSATLSADDRIVDSNTNDNDSLNVTLTADPAAMDVTNVENINLDWDAYATPDVDLDNVSGATVTVSSTKNGYLGNLNVTNAGDNSIVAGAGVTGRVDIEAIEDATVTADNARVVDIGGTTAADGSLTVNAAAASNVTVNGGDDVVINAAAATEINLTNTSLDTATITVGDDVDLLIDSSGGEYTLSSATDVTITMSTSTDYDTITLAGDGAITLDFSDSTDLNGNTIVNGGVIKLGDDAAGAIDLDEISHTSLVYEVAQTTGTHTIANNANITLEADLNAAVTWALTTANDGDSDTISLTIEDDQAAAIAFDGATNTDFETVNIVANAAAGSGVDLTLADVQATGNTVNLTSDTNEVTISAFSAETVDASAVAGDFVLTGGATNEDVTIVGGTSKNTYDLLATTADVTVVSSGNVNDTVTLDTTTGAASLILGDGTNTVNGNSITDGDVSIIGGSGVDTINLTGLAATTAVSVQTLSGKDSVVLGGTVGSGADTDISILTGDGDDTITLGATTNMDASDSLTLDGGNGDDTLKFGAVDLTDLDLATISNFEILEATSTSANIDASLLNGEDYLIKGTGTATETLTATMDKKGTVDLSSLTFDGTIAKAIGGITLAATSGNDTITASSGNDTIDLDDGTDSFYANDGTDHVSMGTGSDVLYFEDEDDAEVIGDTATLASATLVAAADTVDLASWDTFAEFTSGTDSLDLSAYNLSVKAIDASGGELTIGDGGIAVIDGVADAGNDTFTISNDGSGTDSLLVWDQDTSSGVELVGVYFDASVVDIATDVTL